MHRALLMMLLAIASSSAAAESIDLVCVAKDGFSINFKIDTSAQKVESSGVMAREVAIDATLITFKLDLEGATYFHIINRSSGNMTVKAPNGYLLSGYGCERARPKF